MKIQPVINFNTSFKGAALNINAFSDNHGNLDRLDTFFSNIEDNRDVLFLENKKGNKNVQIIAGDWFISGGTKGYQSNPNANSHFFQIEFFNTFMERLKKLIDPSKKQTAGYNTDMPVYFLAGNHEFDAGENEFKRIADEIDAKILMTNLDVQNSPVLEDETGGGKIVQQDILEIEDDKNPNLKHKVLFLGISPVNMPYYAKGVKGIAFLDTKYKAEKLLSPEDYKRTFDDTVRRIEEFKKENPKGLVVVSSHTGANFSENLARKLGSKINIIFDGHEHRDEISDINGVKIAKLSQNFKKHVNVKFFIDDDGNLKDDIQISSYYPFNKPRTGSFFEGYYKGMFFRDLLNDFKITPTSPDVETLSVEHVRSKNNFLANFITDSILTEIQSEHPDVDIFGINASAIRTSLDTLHSGGTNIIRILEALNGITQNDAELYKNKVSGSLLIELILDNLLFNEPAPEKCPLMHYSGLIIDKGNLLFWAHIGKKPDELAKYVIFEKTGEPVKPDETYTIANVKKFFVKSKNPLIKDKLFKEALPLNLNAKDLFIQHMNSNKEHLSAKCDVRIID